MDVVDLFLEWGVFHNFIRDLSVFTARFFLSIGYAAFRHFGFNMWPLISLTPNLLRLVISCPIPDSDVRCTSNVPLFGNLFQVVLFVICVMSLHGRSELGEPISSKLPF